MFMHACNLIYHVLNDRSKQRVGHNRHHTHKKLVEVTVAALVISISMSYLVSSIKHLTRDVALPIMQVFTIQLPSLVRVPFMRF